MSVSSSSGTRLVQRALVLDIKEVARSHYQLELRAPLLAKNARPGQFVHVLTLPRANTQDNGWSFDPFLRRAFSIMSVDGRDQQSIKLLFRVEGRGTKALAKARPGDEIDLIGPLGTPFDTSPFGAFSAKDNAFHVKQNAPVAMVVGGGVGVPPLLYLSQFLRQHQRVVHAIIGARSASEIICWDELSAVCEEIRVSTNDGSRGHQGRVTDLMTKQLAELAGRRGGEKPIVYACGPLPMLRAVAQLCEAAEVRCQVSLEENMPCGVGVCNGCVVRVRPTSRKDKDDDNGADEAPGHEWSPYRAYRRVCIEGPACWADEIDWEQGS